MSAHQSEYDRQARAFDEVAAAAGIRLTWAQLEGFAAGLAACPESVSASEWLEAVWDADGDYEGVVDGAAGARAAARTVLSGCLADVARALAEAPEAYRPVLPTDEVTGEGRLGVVDCWFRDGDAVAARDVGGDCAGQRRRRGRGGRRARVVIRGRIGQPRVVRGGWTTE